MKKKKARNIPDLMEISRQYNERLCNDFLAVCPDGEIKTYGNFAITNETGSPVVVGNVQLLPGEVLEVKS